MLYLDVKLMNLYLDVTFRKKKSLFLNFFYVIKNDFF